MQNLYDALSPYGATLQSFQPTPTLPNFATPLVTVGIGASGTLKFAYDRLEFTFNEFTNEFSQSLPHLLLASTRWLRDAITDFGFSSHEFNYFSHSYIKDSTTEEVLASINPRIFKSTGLTLGHGAIFRHAIPERKWVTQVIFDKSFLLPNALFMGFGVTINQDSINYDSLLLEGRMYLASLLQELDLRFPELSQ
jgi:hypothetical protein